MQDFMLSITGPKAAGKTTMMKIILEALANHGLLSAADTKAITENPDRFVRAAIIFDTQHCEQYEIEICPAALSQHILETKQ